MSLSDYRLVLEILCNPHQNFREIVVLLSWSIYCSIGEQVRENIPFLLK